MADGDGYEQEGEEEKGIFASFSEYLSLYLSCCVSIHISLFVAPLSQYLFTFPKSLKMPAR